MRIANIRLEHIQNGVLSPDDKTIRGIAKELLERRRWAGDAPAKCEGCGKKATTADSEGTPLCRACLRSLAPVATEEPETVGNGKAPKSCPTDKTPPPVMNDSPDDAPIGVQHIDGNTGEPFKLGGQ